VNEGGLYVHDLKDREEKKLRGIIRKETKERIQKKSSDVPTNRQTVLSLESNSPIGGKQKTGGKVL